MADYIINFTDPLKGTYIIRPYTSDGNRFPTSSTRAATATAAHSVLLLHGKGHPEYGERTDENLLHLAENFSGASKPIIDGSNNTTVGVIWHREALYNRIGAGNWQVWNQGTLSWDSATVTEGTIASRPSTSSNGTLYFATNVSSTTSGSTGTLYRYSSDERGIDQWVEREYSERGTLTTEAPTRNVLVNHDGTDTGWATLFEASSGNALLLDASGATQTVLDPVIFATELTIGTGSPTSGILTVEGKATFHDTDSACDSPTVTIEGSNGPVLFLNQTGSAGTAPAILFHNPDNTTYQYASLACRDGALLSVDRNTTGETCTAGSPSAEPVFRITEAGLVRTLITNYESLVLADNDIPNKRYVDLVAAGAIGADTYLVSGSFSGGILSLSYNSGSPSGFTVSGFTADQVPFTPVGAISATEVQSALQELDTEKAALAGATFTGAVVFNGATTFTQPMAVTADATFSGSSVIVPAISGASSSSAAVNKGYLEAVVSGITGGTNERKREVFTPTIPLGSPVGSPYVAPDVPHVLPFEYTAGTNRLMVFVNGIKLYADVAAHQDVLFNSSLSTTDTISELPTYTTTEFSGSPLGWTITGNHTGDFSIGDVIRVDGATGVSFQSFYTVSGTPSLAGSDTFIPVTPIGGTPTPGAQTAPLGVDYNFNINLDFGGAQTIGVVLGSPISTVINGIDISDFSDLITAVQLAMEAVFGLDAVSVYLFNGNLRFVSLNSNPAAGGVVLSQGSASTTEYLFSVVNLGGYSSFVGFGSSIFGAKYDYYEADSGSPYTPAGFGSTTDTIVLSVPTLQSTDVIEVLAE